MLNWTATKKEMKIITKIAKRWMALGDFGTLQDVIMDIQATHCNGCPLDLSKLLTADDATFGHDIGGITRYLDRSTGLLTDCFVPRCAAQA